MNNVDLEKMLDSIFFNKNPKNEFYYHYSTNKDFKNSLLNILPEVKACASQEQNSEWHIYNVLDHTLHSIEHINKLSSHLPHSEQKVLAYTMFYHDLGKPKALEINLKSDSNPSFAYHQELSARIVEKTIKNFSFNEEEQFKIYTLVKNHDYFMLSYKNIDKYINDQDELKECIKDDIFFFGRDEHDAEMLKDLILVSKADNMAQNPEMTEKSLEFIDKYEKTLNDISSLQEDENCQ